MKKQNVKQMQHLLFATEALMNELMHAEYRAKQHTQASCYVSTLLRQNNPTEDESGVKGLSGKANRLLCAAHLNFKRQEIFLKYIYVLHLKPNIKRNLYKLQDKRFMG